MYRSTCTSDERRTTNDGCARTPRRRSSTRRDARSRSIDDVGDGVVRDGVVRDGVVEGDFRGGAWTRDGTDDDDDDDDGDDDDGVDARARWAVCARASRRDGGARERWWWWWWWRRRGGASSLLDALEDACPVPRDQRPASQYEELRDGALLSWPGLGVAPYAVRMTGLFGFFYGVIAYPIACGSYDPNTQFAEACVSALVGASGATAAMALNMYNGWSYVRDRLLSATVEYEETGWYDGQVYVKDPEMLARDRLLGTYTVRPVVEMLRKTLLGCGAVALISLAALRTIDAPNGEMNGDYGSNMGYYSQTSAEEEDEDEEAMRLMMMQSMGAPAASAPAAESDASVGEDE